MSQSDLNELLQRISPNRREFVKRLVGTAAFATPLIASFSMEGLTVSLQAASSNQGRGSNQPGGSNQPHGENDPPGGCNPNQPGASNQSRASNMPPGLCTIPLKNPQAGFLSELFNRIFGGN